MNVILEAEPQRRARLLEITNRVRSTLDRSGLRVLGEEKRQLPRQRLCLRGVLGDDHQQALFTRELARDYLSMTRGEG